jgi:hypothetical protein
VREQPARLGIIVVSILAGLVFQGCQALPGASEPAASEAERNAYAQALSRQVDDPEGTERALEDFLRVYPQSPLGDDARMRLGEMAQARGDSDAALRQYSALVRDFPSGDRADAARVEMARLELAQGNLGAAATAIERVKLNRLSSAERRLAYGVLAEVAEDPVEELRWLSRVRGAERSTSSWRSSTPPS